jgi:hypothetical protein
MSRSSMQARRLQMEVAKRCMLGWCLATEREPGGLVSMLLLILELKEARIMFHHLSASVGWLFPFSKIRL